MILVVLSIYAVASLAAFAANVLDKRAAARGGRRISEATLHGIELLGGFLGAFAAQRLLRHKTRKRSYRIVFWSIVAAHAAGWALVGLA